MLIVITCALNQMLKCSINSRRLLYHVNPRSSNSNYGKLHFSHNSSPAIGVTETCFRNDDTYTLFTLCSLYAPYMICKITSRLDTPLRLEWWCFYFYINYTNYDYFVGQSLSISSRVFLITLVIELVISPHTSSLVLLILSSHEVSF